MSTNDNDSFFDIAYDDREVPEAVERDQWKRPLLLPGDSPAGKTLAEKFKDHKRAPLVPYTRASSLADKISNKTGLHIWDIRQVVRGLAIREDLCAMAAALPPLTDVKKLDAPTNALLDEYAEAAREAAAAHAKANHGTAVHGFTDPGARSAVVPERMVADVESYWDIMGRNGIRQVASEFFVANDELNCAGTPDGIYEVPGYGMVVGDKKTGKANMHATSIQMATYAHAEHYTEDGKRVPLNELVGAPVSREVGLYIHIPKGEGKTSLWMLDLVKGIKMARLAAQVRDFETDKDIATCVDDQIEVALAAARMMIFELIEGASSRPEFAAIWESNRHLWTPEMTDAVNAKT